MSFKVRLLFIVRDSINWSFSLLLLRQIIKSASEALLSRFAFRFKVSTVINGFAAIRWLNRQPRKSLDGNEVSERKLKLIEWWKWAAGWLNVKRQMKFVSAVSGLSATYARLPAELECD